MSGEYQVASAAIDAAMIEAESTSNMDPDTMALALLSMAIRKLGQFRTRADIEMCIDYNLDNIVEQDQVITRGC